MGIYAFRMMMMNFSQTRPDQLNCRIRTVYYVLSIIEDGRKGSQRRVASSPNRSRLL